MPAVLVTADDLQAHLGLGAEADQELLQGLADAVEAMFLQACGRAARPFLAAAENGRVELHDGTGSGSLWLDYPAASAAAVTSLTIGADHDDPDETLTADDLVVVTGSREVRRLDGCWGAGFGALDAPARVRVTYDAAAEAPVDAKLAITRVAAAIYLQRGSEGARSERTGAVQTDWAAIAAGDPVWQAAVAAHRDVAVV
jgi:hypothetical protein